MVVMMKPTPPLPTSSGISFGRLIGMSKTYTGTMMMVMMAVVVMMTFLTAFLLLFFAAYRCSEIK